MMINAKSCKDFVENNSDIDSMILSLYGLIYEEVSNRKYHCDWYSSRYYNCTQKDIEELNKIVKELKELKFTVRMSVFEPNPLFPNRRVKIHVNWE